MVQAQTQVITTRDSHKHCERLAVCLSTTSKQVQTLQRIPFFLCFLSNTPTPTNNTSAIMPKRSASQALGMPYIAHPMVRMRRFNIGSYMGPRNPRVGVRKCQGVSIGPYGGAFVEKVSANGRFYKHYVKRCNQVKSRMARYTAHLPRAAHRRGSGFWSDFGHGFVRGRSA